MMKMILIHLIFAMLAVAVIGASAGCVSHAVNPDASTQQKALADLMIYRDALAGSARAFSFLFVATDDFTLEEQLDIRQTHYDIDRMLTKAEDMALQGADPRELISMIAVELQNLAMKRAEATNGS